MAEGIVHDDNFAGADLRDEDLLNIRLKGVAINQAIENEGCDEHS